MSFSISLYRNDSEPEAMTKNLTLIAEYNGTLKEATNIIDPSILIECNIADVASVNYIYIPSFRRYYYVTSITSVRTRLVQFSCHCDVLMSFRNEILSNRAIVKRQESKYNLYVPDSVIGSYAKPSIEIKKFPNTFSGHSYVLLMAGCSVSETSILTEVYADCVHNTQQDSYTTVKGGVGITYQYMDNGVSKNMYLGGRYFQNAWTTAGVWQYRNGTNTNLISSDNTIEPVWIPKPFSSGFTFYVCRTNVGYDTYGQESLNVWINDDPDNPDILVKHSLLANDITNPLELTFPHEYKRIRFEYAEAGAV